VKIFSIRQNAKSRIKNTIEVRRLLIRLPMPPSNSIINVDFIGVEILRPSGRFYHRVIIAGPAMQQSQATLVTRFQGSSSSSLTNRPQTPDSQKAPNHNRTMPTISATLPGCTRHQMFTPRSRPVHSTGTP
jgi:hypothetical protein